MMIQKLESLQGTVEISQKQLFSSAEKNENISWFLDFNAKKGDGKN